MKNELKNAAFKVTFFNSNSEKFYKKAFSPITYHHKSLIINNSIS